MGIEVTERRGRRRGKLLDELKERIGYCHLEEEALHRTMWRARFGRDFEPVVRQTTEWVNHKEALSLRCLLTTASNYVRIGNRSTGGNFTFVCYRILSSFDMLLCSGKADGAVTFRTLNVSLLRSCKLPVLFICPGYENMGENFPNTAHSFRKTKFVIYWRKVEKCIECWKFGKRAVVGCVTTCH
jgi:hypothetical protein